MKMIKLVALTLVLTGCNFDSKEPDRLNVDTAVKMDESSISLPISIQAGEIQSLLQEAINENSNGNRLFFESGRKVGNGVSIQTDVKTRGNVTVYARNNVNVRQAPVTFPVSRSKIDSDSTQETADDIRIPSPRASRQRTAG